jgi:hypothetical protein
MKKLLFAVFVVVAGLASCKKTVEQKQEDLLYQVITNGRWYVEQYKENTTDVTGDFFGYEFQFYNNNTVEGIKSSVSKRGTWSGDSNTKTITAAFPASAGDTLKRLTYTWKIVDSYLDFVKAETTTATGKNTLNLRKK